MHGGVSALGARFVDRQTPSIPRPAHSHLLTSIGSTPSSIRPPIFIAAILPTAFMVAPSVYDPNLDGSNVLEALVRPASADLFQPCASDGAHKPHAENILVNIERSLGMVACVTAQHLAANKTRVTLTIALLRSAHLVHVRRNLVGTRDRRTCTPLGLLHSSVRLASFSWGDVA